MKYIRLFLFISFLLKSTSSFAYNFLHINPTTGNPVGWEPGTTIQYYLDPGPLGGLTNDQAHTLLKEAMKIWENISPDANVPKFEFAGYLPEDVDGTNYENYINLSSCYSSDLASCPTDAQKNLQTVIVFDQDGAILRNELCKIVPCAAAAGARVFSGNSADPKNIIQGIAVFGASSTGSLTGTGVDATVGTFVHELGHLLGLAHSYLNQQSFGGQYFPTMMGIPAISGATPTPDDIAGISALYPAESLSANEATIKGKILKSDGSPMQFVNVIARNIEDPICEAYTNLNGRTCDLFPAEECNNYEIKGLPPGTYTVEVEEVDPNLATTLAPGLIPNVDVLYGDAEFWNEGDVANDPSNLTSSTIALDPGEIRQDVDITLDRSEVTDDRVKFIPSDVFTLGPGTRCPERPPIDYATMIGIDETPTTGGNSGGSGGCSLIP